MQNGNWHNGTMSRRGYNIIAQKFKEATKKTHNHKQIRNLITKLKTQYRFVKLLRKHTGFGRREDDSIIAPASWWKEHCQGEYKECKKFEHGWPLYTEHLDEMFRNVVVDGSTSCIPGQHPAYNVEEDDQYEGGETDNDVPVTPVTGSSGKRGSSTQSTGHTPKKKRGLSSGSGSETKGRKSTILGGFFNSVVAEFRTGVQSLEAKVDKCITFKVNHKEEEEEELKKCWALVDECGLVEGSDEYYAAWQLFEKEYNRKHFIHQFKSNSARVDWLKRWMTQPKV